MKFRNSYTPVDISRTLMAVIFLFTILGSYTYNLWASYRDIVAVELTEESQSDTENEKEENKNEKKFDNITFLFLPDSRRDLTLLQFDKDGETCLRSIYLKYTTPPPEGATVLC